MWTKVKKTPNPSTFYPGETMETLDLEGFKEKLLRRTKSQTTVDTYLHGVRRFETFCQERLDKPMQEVVDDLAIGRADVYQVLDRFVGWVATQTDKRTGTPLMPRSVHTYVEGTKKFLRYHGVDIIVERLKEKVTMPLTGEIPDVPLEKPVLRKLLISDMPMGMRVAIGIMASGGTRIGETSMLKVSDLHLDEDPCRVSIRKETVKATRHGRLGRDTFITPEVAELVKQYIETKGRKPTDNLFPKSYSPEGFRDELKTQLKKMGLAQKLDGHPYHQIHPHVFRKYFSRLVDPIIGPTARNALTGHTSYLATYTKQPLHERQDDYRKCIPVLSVLNATTEEEQKLQAALAVWKNMGLSADLLKQAENQMRSKNLFEPDEELLNQVKEWLAESWGMRLPDRRSQNAGVW